jgi:tetratricopeptide (TPR) repeat protein
MRHYAKQLASLLLAATASLAAQVPANVSDASVTAGATPQRTTLPIKAKTHEEYVAYQAAIANKQNPEAIEKSALEFAAKFPDSSIRLLLFRAVMKSFRSAGDSQKMMEAALKVLELDKNDPEALLSVAEVQEEHTTPMDLDREQRMDQALANAQHALATIETDLIVPVGTAADREEAFKKYLRSSSLAIIGTIQYKREHYSDAETTLRGALAADPANPDGVVLLRLALALDQQKKYEDALQQANHAVELTKENTDVGRLVRTERDRLTALIAQNSAGKAPSDAAAPSTEASPSN